MAQILLTPITSVQNAMKTTMAVKEGSPALYLGQKAIVPMFRIHVRVPRRSTNRLITKNDIVKESED
jgi:hypothetical protein